MADEVIIEEYAAFDASMQIPTLPITTQIVDIGTLSAKLNAQTTYIRIRSKGTGFWWIAGDSTASAAADTNGNTWLEAGDFTDQAVTKNSNTYIDTAVDA